MGYGPQWISRDDKMKDERIKKLLDKITSDPEFKRTRSNAILAKLCVMCENPNLNFIDQLSRREYKISGMCQTCQDNFFKEEGKQ